MKNHPFFKRALISLMGLFIVLNCTSQTTKEKKAERNALRKSENIKSFEKLGKLIDSRNFVFKSGGTESGQIPSVVVMVNGPAVRISGLDSSEWSENGSGVKYSISKPTSGRINDWELTENPEELTYSISFIAQTTDFDSGVLIKIFSDKTAIAQFGGRQIKGRVTPN